MWLVSLAKTIGGFGTGYAGYLAYKYLDNWRSEKFSHLDSIQSGRINDENGNRREAVIFYKKALSEIDFDLGVHSRHETRISLIDKREYVLSRLDKLGESEFAASELKNTDALRLSLRKSR